MSLLQNSISMRISVRARLQSCRKDCTITRALAPEGMLDCNKILFRDSLAVWKPAYRVAVAANFFTMASSNLRSLSFRFVE